MRNQAVETYPMNHNDYHFVLGNLEAIALLPDGFTKLKARL